MALTVEEIEQSIQTEIERQQDLRGEDLQLNAELISEFDTEMLMPEAPAIPAAPKPTRRTVTQTTQTEPPPAQLPQLPHIIITTTNIPATFPNIIPVRYAPSSTTSVSVSAPKTLPSTSKALPSTSKALPSTSKALPSTSKALPSTSKTLPSTSKALPSTKGSGWQRFLPERTKRRYPHLLTKTYEPRSKLLKSYEPRSKSTSTSQSKLTKSKSILQQLLNKNEIETLPPLPRDTINISSASSNSLLNSNVDNVNLSTLNVSSMNSMETSHSTPVAPGQTTPTIVPDPTNKVPDPASLSPQPFPSPSSPQEPQPHTSPSHQSHPIQSPQPSTSPQQSRPITPHQRPQPTNPSTSSNTNLQALHHVSNAILRDCVKDLPVPNLIENLRNIRDRSGNVRRCVHFLRYIGNVTPFSNDKITRSYINDKIKKLESVEALIASIIEQLESLNDSLDSVFE